MSDSKSTALQKYRSRWYYANAIIMWLSVFGLAGASLAANVGMILIALFFIYATWSLQSVVFTDANTTIFKERHKR